MKLNEKLLTKISIVMLTLFVIFIIFQIARESLGWAILAGSFLFLVACWLHHEPDSCRRKRERDERIARESREQREMINE